MEKSEMPIGDCPLGSYMKDDGNCDLCRSNNDLNLCEACTGTSFAECLKCYDGYYMNEDY